MYEVPALGKKAELICIPTTSGTGACPVLWALAEVPACRRPAASPRLPHPACLTCPSAHPAGSEVTPFAVVTDEKTGQKYPLADCERGLGRAGSMR